MVVWQVSLGFYPVSPGSGEYVLGMPLFDKATLHLSSSTSLTIESSPNYPHQHFLHQVFRDG